MAITNNTGFERKGDIHRRQIDVDGTPVARFTESTNEFGMYAIGNKLYDNGSVVALSGQEHPFYTNEDGVPKFGEVDLVTEGKVINITLENYNILYNHGLVAGYKYFDPWDVYRIVSNVANAPQVTYVRDHKNETLTFTDNGTEIVFPEMPYLLYNNVVGESSHNTITEQNVKNMNSPYLGVRYFNPRIKPSETIKVRVCVDNYFADYIQGRTTNGVWKQAVTGPYTLELRIEDSDDDPNKIVRKTIYAGESVIETPAFGSTVGETWFTLRCIDENGVASATHYLDVMIDPVTPVVNTWEVSDDDFGTGEGKYNIYPDDEIEEGDTEMVKAYKNKQGFTALFADAVANGHNCVKLPKHTYKICDYANKGSDGEIVLNDSTCKYWYCEISNGVVAALQRIEDEDDVIADTKGIFRYKWYNENLAAIIPAITVENEARYNAEIADGKSAGTAQQIADANCPIPPNTTYDFGEHANDIIYANGRNGSYHKSLPDYVTHAIDYFNMSFHTVIPYDSNGQPLGDIDNGTTTIYNSNNAVIADKKYYFVVQSNASAGEWTLFPSDFTLDMNGSTWEIVKQYDFRKAFCITLDSRTNTHIKHGKIKGGMETYEWKRAMVRQALKNPCEHAIPIQLRGNRFCSFEDVTIEGALGYTIQTEIDADNAGAISRYSAVTPCGYTSAYNGSGMYDHIRLSLSTGELTTYDTTDDEEPETFVMSNTNLDSRQGPVYPYVAGNVGVTDETIGYIPIDMTRLAGGARYIFVGYGQSWVTQKGKRKEIFVFFYDGSNNLIKAVKTRTTWMVRIPDDAEKLRVMGYGHSIKLTGINPKDTSIWNSISVSQVRCSAGMVYKDCTIQRTRSAIVGGLERQVIYDHVTFKDVAVTQLINPNNEGSWSAFTWACIDLESGSPLAKYFTIRNCKGMLSKGYNGTTSIIIQGGEDVQIEDSKFKLNEWGMLSGLIKGNTFSSHIDVDDGSHPRALDIVRRDAFVYHKHVQWDDNTIIGTGDAGSVLLTVNALKDVKEEFYDDVRELAQPFRFADINKDFLTNENQESLKALVHFRNSKNGSKYYD